MIISSPLKVVVRVMNDLKNKGVIDDYAVYGAIAVMNYTEPFGTTDLDITVSMKVESPIILLTPIYNEFTRLGYLWQEEHIIVEGFPVEFMVGDELELEAISQANIVKVDGDEVKVLTPEYLIALFVRSDRPRKDRPKVYMLLEQAKIDYHKLQTLLMKCRLLAKFERIYEVSLSQYEH